MLAPFFWQVDVWACGVVVYILLGGYPPFYDDDDAKLFQKIVKGQFAFDAPFWNPVSASAKDLIRQMLTVDPTARPTAAALLHHPWVTGKAATAGGGGGRGGEAATGDLTGAIEQLKRWTAKRRLKVGGQT
jgi:serine/threonine protein kinase